jgi:hypothetical protein
MSDGIRDALALVALFGAMACAYLWLGTSGLAGMWFGLAAAWAVTGLSVGYWMGLDPLAERMIPELMRRLRAERAASRLQDSPPAES